MATLIRRPGSPYWIACFDVTQPDGTIRRLKKSTKRTKRSEANTEAARMEDAERKGSAATDETAAQAYAILQDAAAIAARGGLTEVRARDFVAKLALLSTGERLKFFTVREWANEWLSMKDATRKAASLSKYRTALGSFLSWLGDKADGRIEALTKSDIRRFRDDFRSGWTPKGQQAPRTGSHTNTTLSVIASMLRTAVREGLIVASPTAALEPLPELDSTKREVFTVPEIAAMVAAAPSEDWQGMILLGFYTGARLGDSSRMLWGNIDMTAGILTFMPQKTDRHQKTLEIAIHPRLAAWLNTREQGTPTAPLFPSLCPIDSKPSTLSQAFARIMEAAGVDRKITRAGGEGQRAQHARSFHSLRHSLASTLANLDIPEEIRRRITGHESAEIHQKYTHHEAAVIAAAVGKLPSF